MRKDVSAHKDMLRGSEHHRYELQEKFVRLSETVKHENTETLEERRRLIEDNQRLREELEA
jgi:hypothetical protein